MIYVSADEFFLKPSKISRTSITLSISHSLLSVLINTADRWVLVVPPQVTARHRVKDPISIENLADISEPQVIYFDERNNFPWFSIYIFSSKSSKNLNNLMENWIYLFFDHKWRILGWWVTAKFSIKKRPQPPRGRSPYPNTLWVLDDKLQNAANIV